MYIKNPPTDIALRNSLEKILHKTFPATSGEQTCLYLVEDVSEIESLDATVKRIASSGVRVLVNTLSIGVAAELRRQKARLEEQGITILSDYSNPSNDHQDKTVSFYTSEECRPLINHVYREVAAKLSPLLEKYHGFIASIGSDLLPNFPCKLDTDILVCIPGKDEYNSFCSELHEADVFILSPQIIDVQHVFFYAQLLGSPIDLHVYNSSLEDNPLYRQTRQLHKDLELQQKYRQFKLENEGVSASDYRKAKAQFRQNVGWTQ